MWIAKKCPSDQPIKLLLQIGTAGMGAKGGCHQEKKKSDYLMNLTDLFF